MDIVNAIKLVLEQFTNETVNISLTVLLFSSFVLIAYWYYNRRKFHQLRHQIPASVVKNYLDSIIANSNALKSSLFRGGGLELGEGVPSILPTTDLPLGGVSSSGSDHSEELAQKNAEIANLKAIVNQKNVTIAELEKMLANAKENSGAVGMSDEESDILKNEVSSLKGQLEEANNLLENSKSSGGDEEIIKERDGLKERLMEYEIIEEDLANLKRYQQENEELKKTIESLQSSDAAPAAMEPETEATSEPVEEAAPEAAEEPADEEAAPQPVAEATPAEPVEDKTPAATGEEPDVPQNEGEQKSAEELLSEFEKMLG